MSKSTILIVLICVISVFGYSQEKKYGFEDTFKWMKETFEQNDAGFAYVIEVKGQSAYDALNEMTLEKIKTAKNSDEYLVIMRNWQAFFRSGHIYIVKTEKGNKIVNNNPKKEVKKKETKKKKGVIIKENKFKKYLDNKKILDYEGIWQSGGYVIGVKKDKDSYTGYIMESGNPSWTKGEVKFKINLTDNSVVYYMGDHSPRNFKNVDKIGDAYIEMDFINLKRIYPETKPEKSFETYLKAINATEPYLEKIDETTLLLRIPSFAMANKKKIDSILLSNRELVLSTKNLILDIRNNGGGSDSSYKELIPFLYTNPIRTVGMEILSTPLNNARMESFIKNEDDFFSPKDIKGFEKDLIKLNEKIGEFVQLNKKKVSVRKINEINKYPQNIGILINYNNGSTAEQFLLAAKQSKKVKLFGVTTRGVLDISNMNFVISPCGNYRLGYCLSKSFRIPDMAIDGKGIQPDYYLGQDIPKHEWIQFAKDTFNQ